MIEVHFVKFNVFSQSSKGTNNLSGCLIVDVVLALFRKKIERDGMRQLIQYGSQLVLDLGRNRTL
jgi:hypothetical protein